MKEFFEAASSECPATGSKTSRPHTRKHPPSHFHSPSSLPPSRPFLQSGSNFLGSYISEASQNHKGVRRSEWLVGPRSPPTQAICELIGRWNQVPRTNKWSYGASELEAHKCTTNQGSVDARQALTSHSPPRQSHHTTLNISIKHFSHIDTTTSHPRKHNIES